jgi:hypothetical protein
MSKPVVAEIGPTCGIVKICTFVRRMQRCRRCYTQRGQRCLFSKPTLLGSVATIASNAFWLMAMRTIGRSYCAEYALATASAPCTLDELLGVIDRLSAGNARSAWADLPRLSVISLANASSGSSAPAIFISFWMSRIPRLILAVHHAFHFPSHRA